MTVPATTIDMKKHVTLSWMPKTNETRSDILIVSGLQNHGGVYQNAFGGEKNIRVESGLPGSQPDGTSKRPHTRLPLTATQDWNVEDIVADKYGVQFTADADLNAKDLVLGEQVNGVWKPLVTENCVVDAPWDGYYLVNEPVRDVTCAGQPVVGYDSQYGNRWWMIADRDLEIALVKQ